MSNAVPLRSSTGCLTCKTRRKKCDETKPKCLRCQRLGVDCPGYVYVRYRDKRVQRLRTLPAPPRINAPVPRDPPGNRAVTSCDLGSPLRVTRLDTSLSHAPGHYTPGHPPELMGAHGTPDLYLGADTPNGNVDYSWLNGTVGDFSLLALSNPWMNVLAPDFLQAHDKQSPSILNITPADPPQMISPPPEVEPTLMTYGQSSLFRDLLSLGHPENMSLQLSSSSSSSPPSNESTRTSPSWLSPAVGTDKIDDEVEDEDPEGAIMIISRMPALDPNVESNALPFVLQNYAAWISRRAFEPLKMTSFARDLVYSHFGGGDESRWSLTLLANIGGTLARTNGIGEAQTTMLSALQDSVFRQTASAGVVTMNDAWNNTSIMLLETALEAMSMHFYVSPIPQAERLRRAVAPVFRRLCPDPPGMPIHLPSLMNQPLFCLRHYAHLDIIMGALAGFPMMFRYDTTWPSDEPIYESIFEIQDESSPQWLIGIPDRLVVVFARINTLREDGAADPEMPSEIERDIRNFKPFQSVSTDSFLMVTRLVVQECWRQVAYIYLYMALYGESSEGNRVKSAMKQLMNLVNGMTPGRLTNNFLVASFMMAAPAARRPADRQVLVKRIVDPYRGSREGGVADNLRMIEDCWARADAEGRPVVWSDVIISRIRVVGM